MDVVQSLVEVLLVVTDPTLLRVRERLDQMALSLHPAAQRLLGQRDLGQGTRTLGQFVRAAELLERFLVLTPLAQFEPVPDQRVFAARIARLGVLAACGGVAAPGEQDDGKE